MNIDLETELRTGDRSYARLAEAVSAAVETAEGLAQAKYDLERERAEMLAAGLVDAKNEATREAYLRERLSRFYVARAVAEREERQARYHVDMAQLEVDRVRLRVRLMELAAGMERPAA